MYGEKEIVASLENEQNMYLLVAARVVVCSISKIYKLEAKYLADESSNMYLLVRNSENQTC